MIKNLFGLVGSQKNTVTLQPVMMPYPTESNVYCPSLHRKIKTLNYDDFISKYSPVGIMFHPNRYANPDTIENEAFMTTAYGYGNDAWYVIVD